MFLMLSNHFNVLMSKIIFKKLKKYHQHIFYHEKLFKKSLHQHYQTSSYIFYKHD
jgi:uncharacterized membrane protein YbaN (DUF454 family)